MVETPRTIRAMRLRVSLLLLFTLILGSTLSVAIAVEGRLADEYQTTVVFDDSTINAGDIPYNRTTTTSDEWVRENFYLNVSALQRQGRGPFLTGHNYKERTSAEADVVRILVVGDSYTYGVGAADPDMVWQRRVLQQLEKTYPEVSIDLLTLARPGASLLEETEWLTDELLDRIDPDLVLIGHTTNDAYPSGRERSICGSQPSCDTLATTNLKEYTDCIAGDGGTVSNAINKLVNPYFPLVGQKLLLRYCDSIRIEQETTGMQLGVIGEGDPYYQLFMKSVDRIAEINKSYPVVSALLNDDGQLSPVLKNLRIELEAREVTVVEPKASLFDKSNLQPSSLKINPGDSHPGNFVTIRYAQDVVRTIKSVHRADFESKGRSGTRPVPSLVSSYLPVSLEVARISNTRVDVGSAPGAIDLYGSNSDFIEPQEVPCALIGRPHIRLNLEPRLVNGSDLHIESLSSDATVYAVGYDEAGVPTVRLVGESRAATPFVVDLRPGESGLLLSPAEAVSCELDRRLAAPDLRLSISLR